MSYIGYSCRCKQPWPVLRCRLQHVKHCHRHTCCLQLVWHPSAVYSSVELCHAVLNNLLNCSRPATSLVHSSGMIAASFAGGRAVMSSRPDAADNGPQAASISLMVLLGDTPCNRSSWLPPPCVKTLQAMQSVMTATTWPIKRSMSLAMRTHGMALRSIGVMQLGRTL